MANDTIPGKHKILIADYDEVSRKTLANLLREHGQEVIEVTSRELTVPTIETEKPEFILLDVDYPILSGVGILAWIRYNELYRNIPVLLIHRQNVTDSEIFAGWNKGADCSLVEPIVPSELVSFLSRILTPQPEGDVRTPLEPEFQSRDKRIIISTR